MARPCSTQRFINMKAKLIVQIVTNSDGPMPLVETLHHNETLPIMPTANIAIATVASQYGEDAETKIA